jgi:hypothetical protein
MANPQLPAVMNLCHFYGFYCITSVTAHRGNVCAKVAALDFATFAEQVVLISRYEFQTLTALSSAIETAASFGSRPRKRPSDAALVEETTWWVANSQCNGCNLLWAAPHANDAAEIKTLSLIDLMLLLSRSTLTGTLSACRQPRIPRETSFWATCAFRGGVQERT